jgi:hypothetical protein
MLLPRPPRPCEYELTLGAGKPGSAAFVIIERGWQVGHLYFDPEVIAFAERHDLPLVLARHCRAKSDEEDMDILPEHGIGRALLPSVNQFAHQSHHPELAASQLILFSFSGGGSMVARMVAYAPDGMLAPIEYAPGHYNPIGIDTVNLTKAALSVPGLIIANGADNYVEPSDAVAVVESHRKRRNIRSSLRRSQEMLWAGVPPIRI